MDAHAADLGLTFYNGNMFPAQYKGGIFSAQHGSWNRTTPVGARIMFTRVGPDGKAAGTEVFASGWLDELTGEFLGRPVDVQQYLDGSLLVSGRHGRCDLPHFLPGPVKRVEWHLRGQQF